MKKLLVCTDVVPAEYLDFAFVVFSGLEA